MDIRTCGKPELDALNARAKVWREQHSPNPDGIKDQSATPPQDERAPAKDLSTLSPTGQLLLFSVEPTNRSKPPSARRRSSPPDKCSRGPVPRRREDHVGLLKLEMPANVVQDSNGAHLSDMIRNPT